MKTALKILAGILTGILALGCLIPSLSVNITAHAVKGEPWHAGAIYIVAVVAAAVFIIARRIAKRSNEFETARVCLILACVLLSFNAKNAWNSSMIARAEFGDPRRDEIAARNRLLGEEKVLTEFLTQSSPKSSRTIQAEIDAKLLDPKAEGCPEGGAWNGPVTKEVCPKVAALRAEKATAVDYEGKTLRLGEVRGELKGLRSHTVTDPTVQNIGAVLALAMVVTENTQKAIGMGDDLHVALVVESLAVFGPDICWFLFLAACAAIGAQRKPDDSPAQKELDDISEIAHSVDIVTISEEPKMSAAPEIIVEEPVLIAPPAAEPEPVVVRPPQKAGGKLKSKKGRNVTIPTCVQSFFDASVTETGKAADSIGATEFYDAYAASTPNPVSSNMFGRAASAVYKKAEGRTNRYVGVKLRGVRKLRSVK